MASETAVAFIVRPTTDSDRDWIIEVMTKHFASPIQVVSGRKYNVLDYAGLIAVDGDERLALLTYNIEGDECEVGSLSSEREGMGLATALLDAVTEEAKLAGCRRLWLITTNDNLHALGFYQRNGFVLTALHRDAVGRSRRIKPEIPEIGRNGIPLRDELELEKSLR